MLGIGDPLIVLGYVLSIGLAVACVLYGWFKKDEGAGSNG